MLEDMSKIEKRTLTCPKCGKQGEQIVWDSINVDLNPDAKERIFSDEIFNWTCPHCGLKAVAPFTTLYHDMKRKVMIYYFPRRSDDNTGISQHKGRLHPMAGYTCRSVYDLYDFKEKISVLEAGLDDRALEFMKYIFLHRNRPENLPEDVQYRFIAVAPEQESDPSKKKVILQCIVPGKGSVGMLPLPYDFYQGIVSDGVGEKIFMEEADFPEVSQHVLDELMKGR